METILKISVLAIFSLTWVTNTYCFEPDFSVQPKVCIKEIKEEPREPKEMDGFWLTQFLIVEG